MKADQTAAMKTFSFLANEALSGAERGIAAVRFAGGRPRLGKLE
jgi:hypothetical protein